MPNKLQRNSKKRGVRVPRQINTRHTIVSQTEEIQILFGGIGPNLNTISNHLINPGISTSFPWLSTIAQCYEKYRFLSLSFVYTPLKSILTDGQVLMAFDYDVYDGIPLNIQEYSQVKPNTIRHIGQTTTLNIKSSKTLFTRGGTLPPGDQKTYDLGRFMLGFNGHSATSTNYGQLRMRYVVQLLTPQPNAGVPGDSVQWRTDTTGILSVINNELDGLIVAPTPTQLRVDNGVYKVRWNITGIVAPSITAVSGAVVSAIQVITDAVRTFYTATITSTAQSVLNLVGSNVGDLSITLDL